MFGSPSISPRLLFYFSFGLSMASAQTNSVAPASPIILASSKWTVRVSPVTGGAAEIGDPTDDNKMNWVHDKRPWGIVRCQTGGRPVVFDQPTAVTALTPQSSDSSYESAGLKLVVHRAIDDSGIFTETYALTNTGGSTLSLPVGALSITVPFNDSYNEGAPKCLTHNCNAHLWMGGNSSWVNATRMGGTGPHLGLVLTRGSLASYCILDGAGTNDRGNLAVLPSATELKPGETTTLSWALFWHQDWKDFWAYLKKQPQFVRLQAAHYTVVQGQTIEITAESAASLDQANLTLNGATVPVQHAGNMLTAGVKTDHAGEYVFDLESQGRHTWLKANAIIDPMTLLQARVKFIVEKQQKNAPDDPLDGAFLPYDNQTEKQFCDEGRAYNHNEGRERMGMGVLVALSIPLCQDLALRQELMTGLDKYETFLQRELMDDQGLVYDRAGHKSDRRPYNYPWMAHVHLAAYWATQDRKYLDLFLKVNRGYYNLNEGARLYMIGVQMLDSLQAFDATGMKAEHDELLTYFTHNADTIAKNGTNYPKSEVNYEQSIAGPGVQIELEMYLATKNQAYLDSAKQQMACLESFNGQQPDYHLNDLGIRHWDDYWFGKLGLNGDTFPHYWTTITALAFDEYADATGDESYRTRAQDIFLNNMCLFTTEGRGSCAYVYPATLDGHPGNQFDSWANDQDWALVNWLTIYRRHHVPAETLHPSH